jgi:hypothetical protein
MQQASSYSAQQLPITTEKGYTQLISSADQQLAVNGQLQISNSLVLAPSNKPSSPVVGQIYYSKQANEPLYS